MTPPPLCTRTMWAALLMIGGWLSTPAAARDVIEVPRHHQSIQQAIDAAKPGDVVLVAPNTYRERLRIKEGITVRSAGDDAKGKLGLKRAEATVLDGGGLEGRDGEAASPRDGMAGVAMSEAAVLDGFTITNVGRYDDKEWQKHHATQGNEQPHELIGAPGVAGISIAGVTCVVTNNIVHHIGYTGIAITGVEGRRCSPTVFRNVCYRNMGGGIGAMRGSTATIEENICFQNFYAGIGHENAHPLVLNNECFENIRAGIGVSEGARPIVRGNRCYKNRRAGIGIRTGSDTSPVIEFNECFENDMAGIGCEEEATPLIRGNRCHHNKLAGIGCQDRAAPLISKNDCEQNDMAGIGARGSAQPLIHNNRSLSNKLAGIGIEDKSRATIIGNTCQENGTVAIGVRHESTALISENTLERTGGMPPLVAVRESSSARFLDNRMTGGGVASVLADGTVIAINNQFVGTGPRAGGPPNFAIWSQKNSDILLFRNQFEGWRHALHADGAKQLTAIDNDIRKFLSTAIVIKNATGAVRVSGNRAESNNVKDQVVTHDNSGQTAPMNTVEPIPAIP